MTLDEALEVARAGHPVRHGDEVVAHDGCKFRAIRGEPPYFMADLQRLAVDAPDGWERLLRRDVPGS